MTATANHALQRTRAAVTPAASGLRLAPHHAAVAPAARFAELGVVRRCCAHRSMKSFLLHLFVILLASVAPMRAAEPIDVSMVQLLATPDKFHGKFVRVIGYLHLEFEGNGLYLHSEDELAALPKKGLWFDGTIETMKKPKDFTDQYVLVEGTFDAKSHGHMGMWSGTISGIKRVMPWRQIIRGS